MRRNIKINIKTCLDIINLYRQQNSDVYRICTFEYYNRLCVSSVHIMFLALIFYVKVAKMATVQCKEWIHSITENSVMYNKKKNVDVI